MLLRQDRFNQVEGGGDIGGLQAVEMGFGEGVRQSLQELLGGLLITDTAQVGQRGEYTVTGPQVVEMWRGGKAIGQVLRSLTEYEYVMLPALLGREGDLFGAGGP